MDQPNVFIGAIPKPVIAPLFSDFSPSSRETQRQLKWSANFALNFTPGATPGRETIDAAASR
jgi:hypothetical protein